MGLDQDRYLPLARLLTTLACIALLFACVSDSTTQSADPQAPMLNPVSYFEIPVSDLDRAVDFYEAVFSLSLERKRIDGLEMAIFPFHETGQGVSGALAQGNSYIPSNSGVRLYFFVESIEETLTAVISKGGRIAYPKTSVGKYWVAEFEDSEGNQIALSALNNEHAP